MSLTGFGTFERRERAPRTARNPRTGEAIQVGASVAPAFRAGAGFKALLTGTRGEPTSRMSATVEGDEPEAKGGGTKKAGKKARKQVAGESGEPTAKAAKSKKGKNKKAAKAAR